MAIDAIFALLATPLDEIAIFQSLKEGREKQMPALTGPNMSGYSTAGGTRQNQGANGHRGMVPFVRASAEHSEAVGYDESKLMSSAVQTLPDIIVPAYGFLRSILLVVTTSGGVVTTTAPTPAQDAPFNALANIILQEPNGAQICNFPSGYDLYLANKFGGYRYGGDNRNSPNFSMVSSTTVASYAFMLRIPVEVNNRDALGALPNQNSGALFRVKLNLAALATVWDAGSSNITTNPTIRVRAYAEEWDQPEDITDGMPNQTTPPALNTTQYWSRQDFTINSGVANIRLTRMGNYLRNLIFIFKNSSGSRSAVDTNFPDPATLYYDTRPLDTVSRAMWLERMYERYGYGSKLGRTNLNAVDGVATVADSGGGRENGVWPYDFCHEFSGKVGAENRSLWLPTWSSTRFEIGGDWGAAGTLSVLTNDVTVADNVYAAGV